jgi:hypothetical protein
MAGYPNLMPSGFIERMEPCDGPKLYRDQPSRESGGCTLNEFMAKYNPSSRVTDYKFLETIRDLKEFSRHWPNIPSHIREEIVEMLKKSDNGLSNKLQEGLQDESFTNILKNCSSSSGKKKVVNDIIETFANTSDLACVNNSHQVWMMVIIAIVAVVISFLIFMAGS